MDEGQGLMAVEARHQLQHGREESVTGSPLLSSEALPALKLQFTDPGKGTSRCESQAHVLEATLQFDPRA